MTNRLEEELAAWMRQQADQTEHGTDLAPGAFRKSRKIRRRRRIATVAVAAAALAVVVSAGTQAMNLATPDHPDQVVNTPTTSAEPTPTALPTTSKPIVLDFDKLPNGTTNVAWWDAKTNAIRWGRESLPLGQNGTPEGFGRLDLDGTTRYVTFQTTGEVGARLELVGDGATQPLTDDAGTFAVSADAKQVAYTTGQDRGVSVASSSGEVVHRRTFADPPEIAGFAGNNLIVWSRESEVHTVSVWNLDNDQVRTVKGATTAPTTAPGKGLVAVETADPRDPDKKCFQVVDINNDDERVGKPACGMELTSISPDGRYVVLEPVADGDIQDIPYTFVDVRTGRTVLKLQADSWNGITWEPDGTHVVLNAFAGNRNALVRCDLSGKCELASTPVSWEESDLYALAIN